MRRYAIGIAVLMLLALCGGAHATRMDRLDLRDNAYTFATLPAAFADHKAVVYCSDCTQTDPCAGSGSGAVAMRIGATWQCGAGSGYATIDDEDVGLTQRTTLNFEGAGVTCADDTNQTTCTIPGGSGSPGGSSGDLQTNDGAGGFGAYAGDGCTVGNCVTDIASDGTVTCGACSGGGGASHTLVRKTATESVTSSTTLQDDDHLLFAIGANETWAFEFVLQVSGATAGDIKIGVKGPTGIGGFFTVSGLDLAATASPANEQTRAVAGIATSPSGVSAGILGGGHTMKVYGLAVNGGTSGNITLQWAQNTSNGTATSVTINSYLVAHQVS